MSNYFNYESQYSYNYGNTGKLAFNILTKQDYQTRKELDTLIGEIVVIDGDEYKLLETDVYGETFPLLEGAEISFVVEMV